MRKGPSQSTFIVSVSVTEIAFESLLTLLLHSTLDIVLEFATDEDEQQRVLEAIRRHVLGEAGLMGGREPVALAPELVERLRAAASTGEPLN